MKNDNEIQEELVLHIAKAILSGGISARDTMKQIVVIICSAAIPAYLTILKLFEDKLTNTAEWIKLIPVLIWITSLILTLILVRPYLGSVNFKDPQELIILYQKSTRKQHRISLAFSILACSGIAIAAVILV